MVIQIFKNEIFKKENPVKLGINVSISLKQFHTISFILKNSVLIVRKVGNTPFRK